MKRLVFTLLTLTVLTHAQDFGTFIGLQGGASNINIDKENSQSGGSYGLRVGFIKDTGRVYLSGSMGALDDADLNTVDLNFDAITPRAYKFNDSFSIRGFVGVHGGYAQLKPDDFGDDDGVMGGGVAGILLDFPSNITIEIGYKASWADLDYGDNNVKNFQNAYGAFDFKF